MKSLVTDAERGELLRNGRARLTDAAIDPWPVVRLFTPDAHAIWLLAALDPGDGDTAWGVCDLGIGLPALGEVRLSDLAAIRGPRARPVQRDGYFRPARPLSQYLDLAQRNGSLVD